MIKSSYLTELGAVDADGRQVLPPTAVTTGPSTRRLALKEDGAERGGGREEGREKMASSSPSDGGCLSDDDSWEDVCSTNAGIGLDMDVDMEGDVATSSKPALLTAGE